MIAMIVLVLLLLGLTAMVGYSVMSSQQGASQLMNAVEENRRLDVWQAMLESSARAIGEGGELALPIGENLTINGTSYHALPGWISADRRNAWGRPILYCPFAEQPATGVNTPIAIGNGEAYQVSTTLHQNRAYVTGSDPSPMEGVRAFILSPLPNAPLVSCADVVIQNGAYQAVDRRALVRVITSASLRTQRGNEGPMIVNLTDVSVQNEIVEETLHQWNIVQPERVVVRLANAATPYRWSDIDFISNEPGRARTILILGESRSGVTVDALEGLYRTLRFSGVDLYIENVTFSDRMGIVLEHGRLETRNVTLGQTQLKEATWQLSGPTRIEGASSVYAPNAVTLRLDGVNVVQGSQAIEIDAKSGVDMLIDHKGGRWTSGVGASLSLNAPGMPMGAVLRDGAQWYFTSSGLSVDDGPGNTGLYKTLLAVMPGSEARFAAVDIDIAVQLAAGFSVEGTVSLDGVTIDFTRGANFGFVLNKEGILTLEGNTRIGTSVGSTSQPQVGVMAIGGRFVGGEPAQIHAIGDCWQGNLFTSVSDTASGNSLPGDPQYAIVNQSNWTCY